ncbi:hypothetical protein P5W04_10375 [Mycobacteroides abscessus subsp. abscessus]|uniref:hypothetical protein n=1 Tax=Mycobacteroides abscessus TaxID=36809 RepID=UPI000E69A3DA|nr:hypothetical protein [Mycobacteroides abscessus]MBN7484538.1 hypothetical protein [Mycobacteroides abscessus subsp. abscessus]MDO3240520.1 hypothetical protein [Mycobacteroides abscessus subsp. abscessus]RIT75015.1 hypothetical protein D2E77_01655 [Mycobacteroides abscessus]
MSDNATTESLDTVEWEEKTSTLTPSSVPATPPPVKRPRFTTRDKRVLVAVVGIPLVVFGAVTLGSRFVYSEVDQVHARVDQLQDALDEMSASVDDLYLIHGESQEAVENVGSPAVDSRTKTRIRVDRSFGDYIIPRKTPLPVTVDTRYGDNVDAEFACDYAGGDILLSDPIQCSVDIPVAGPRGR